MFDFGFALLCFALLCFALLCFALLCFSFFLLAFALLCFALHEPGHGYIECFRIAFEAFGPSYDFGSPGMLWLALL